MKLIHIWLLFLTIIIVIICRQIGMIGARTYPMLWDFDGENISYTYGNVGIGTSSPQEILHIFSDTSTSTLFIDGEGSCLRLKDSDTSGYTYCTFNDGVQTCSSTDICHR